MSAAAASRLPQLLELCKRRSILLPSYALYNGLRGALDYGPLGVELKRALLNEWWRAVVDARDDVHGVDTPILTPCDVLRASGHEAGFCDPLVDCRLTRERFRADKAGPLLPSLRWRVPISAPDKGKAREWEKVIRERIVPGAKVTRDGRVVYVHLASRPKAPPADDTSIAKMAESLCIPCPGYAEPSSNSPFLTEPRAFNLMFRTHMGAGEIDPTATADTSASAAAGPVGTPVYLRPETAQGIFANFPLLYRAAGKPMLPFGVAQYGKSFRNEIRTEKSVFRTCEFEQLELEYFVAPDTAAAEQWLDRWKHWRLAWWRAYAVNGGQQAGEGEDANVFRLRPHAADELAHYAKACFDVEYRFPWGWGEVEGVANRGEHDLRQHANAVRSLAGIEVPCSVDGNGKMRKGVPWVIESSAGLNRACLVYLLDAYTVDASAEAKEAGDGNGEAARTYLRLHPRIAPVQAAVMPLQRDQKLIDTARKLSRQLRLAGIRTTLDVTGASIGRRYARQDETGTPWCLTIDFDTETDSCVTLRERDSMLQTRVSLETAASVLRTRLDETGFVPPLD
ncbi:hypothetical protein THASP1DRAFT_16938 [Thamnocephalis sphaerospora]|uniref:Aminoacyl-transfer RNA synthetases class-II family profile domain-containing protein n=1 Tax=Thamnocephalis sphaerospora TaxID=78915 RepID=A0A4P9XPY0_9FUNG|nr:hypothetical protein THASP1DRAFT_16938 [Thamnocephalis sphaerospora]|eukprot:RKP07511.1 hypothetical protein THASP1DRAFT_16938 [Thamnocephalis sphaerospora]